MADDLLEKLIRRHHRLMHPVSKNTLHYVFCCPSENVLLSSMLPYRKLLEGCAPPTRFSKTSVIKFDYVTSILKYFSFV